MEKFGALTVLHVPNKNYRRVGKYRKRKFSDGTEEFDINPDLLTAMQLHLEVRECLYHAYQVFKTFRVMCNAICGLLCVRLSVFCSFAGFFSFHAPSTP